MLGEREMATSEQRAQQLNCTRHLSLSRSGVLEVVQAFDSETIKELSCSYVVSDGLHTSDAAVIKVPYRLSCTTPALLSLSYMLYNRLEFILSSIRPPKQFALHVNSCENCE